MTIKIIEGDLLNCDYKFIAHQCNCTSNNAAGLAYYLFEKFPHADAYDERRRLNTINIPGTISIRGTYNDDEGYKRGVINMFSQITPGAPFHYEGEEIFPGLFVNDSMEVREKLFIKCLKHIMDIPDLTSIAFPYKIGCGIARGNWDRYKAVLDKFTVKMNNRNVEVVIIKRPGDE